MSASLAEPAEGRARLSARRVVALALAAIALASGVATVAVLLDEERGSDPNWVYSLVAVNLFLLVSLGGLVARRIFRLWSERRLGRAGSKLHARLIMLFGGLAAAPAVVVAIFAGLFLSLGLQSWFSERVRSALDESNTVAEAYLEEHRSTIRRDVELMGADLQNEQVARLLLLNRELFEAFIAAQATARRLSEVMVFTEAGEVIARYGFVLPQGQFLLQAAQSARNLGNAVELAVDAEGRPQTAFDTVRIVSWLPQLRNVVASSEVYLFVGRYVDQRVVQHVARHREAVATYATLDQRLYGIQLTFALIFALVAALMLLGAVWVGLMVADRLVAPIGGLIDAADKVRAGDLDVRVSEAGADEELKTLSRAFNRMTSQLGSQRRELVTANRALDDRRRFTEAVLAGVSAGVIGLDAQGRIDLPNSSASSLLDIDLDARRGEEFATVVPEMAGLVAQARSSQARTVQSNLTIERGGRTRRLFVRIAPEQGSDGSSGFVVTFDDITDLEQAQRQSAWADVARRIAHEIKNPLTPIQLSAERLKRKYLAEITSDPETFKQCTETIVRQVGDIGRMVDEFSSFARMPRPTIRPENLVELVRRTVVLFANSRTDVSIAVDLPAEAVIAPVDHHLFGQALTNLIQNALDAIEGRDGTDLPRGVVRVSLAHDATRASVIVEDNGRGLPKQDRERLTEPYVTTRAKGTGLGLAIVKKIMEDHGGDLRLEDRAEGGARVMLRFPMLSSETADTDGAARPRDAATKVAVHGA